MLKAPLTDEEIKAALWDMESNKVPGNQGLPPEFFRFFWSEVDQLMSRTIKLATQQGFPITVAQGIISLMEKEGKDLLDIKSWRPLALLNIDFKLLSKVLANRLNKIIPHIIHDDQTGFRKGKGIADNLLDLTSTLELIESRNISAFLVSFDFLKAFDRVEWQVLFKIMDKFGICSEYITMLENLLKGIQSATINQGYTSHYMQITRSLRQGDPISSILFLLLVEVLGSKIRHEQSIEGIVIAKKEKKIGQFADDLWSIIKGSQENLNNLLQVVDKYCQTVGMKINYDKTQVMRLGSLQNSCARFYTVKALNWAERIKILRIEVTPSMKTMLDINFHVLLKKMRSVLDKWSKRALTFMRESPCSKYIGSLIDDP